MGYHSPGRRSRPDRHLAAAEIAAIVLAVAAVVALVVWIITHAGGGHFVF